MVMESLVYITLLDSEFTFDVVCVKWLREVGGLETTRDYYRLLEITTDY